MKFKATICKDGRVVTEIINPGGQTVGSEVYKVYKVTPPAGERVMAESSLDRRTTMPNDLASDLSALAQNFVEQVLVAIHSASIREVDDTTGTGDSKPPRSAGVRGGRGRPTTKGADSRSRPRRSDT